MGFYQIADLIVEMDVFGKTEQNGVAYKCAAPLHELQADMRLECDMKEWRECNPNTDMDTLFYVGINKDFFRQLLQFHGLGIHASTVFYKGYAYLFSAPSGTGKSTHTEKWLRLFGAEMINDDTPALRKIDGVWYAYGTPWSGKGENHNQKAPVGGIAFLRRGMENTLKPLSADKAFLKLYRQISHRMSREEQKKQFGFAVELLQDIPIWQLTCRNDDEAAYVARNGMVQKEI